MKKPFQSFDTCSKHNQLLDFNWPDMLKIVLKTQGPFPLQKNTLDMVSFNIPPDHLQLNFCVDDPAYLTNSSLLSHSRITPLNREVHCNMTQKLKSWLLNQTKNIYCRETYTTASRYLDMFFMRKQDISKPDFQTLGLACLILASKTIQSRVPSISFHVFNNEKIFRFQKNLMKLFNYKLNPITYVQIAEQLLHYWDSYLNSQNKFSQVVYFKDQKKSIKRGRTIFQTLDCLDLVTKSLDIKLIDLVSCTFFIEHRKFCLCYSISKLKKQNQLHAQDTNFVDFHNDYTNIIFKFFEDLKNKVSAFQTLNITDKNILYILQFSRLNPQIKLNSYKKFRQQFLRQTYNEQISQIAQKFLQQKT